MSPGIRITQPAALACLKGRDVPRLLEAAGVDVPSRPNSWRKLDDTGGWCLRLGGGEYLLAHDTDPRALEALGARASGDAAAPACHLLLRADRCIHLEGPRATARLLQVCDIDERTLLSQPDGLALVMLADVAVALHAQPGGGLPAWRIWCDPTYVEHLMETFASLDARSTADPLHLSSPRQDP
jgi:sarcosine oxidase subunit gamma